MEEEITGTNGNTSDKHIHEATEIHDKASYHIEKISSI